MDSNELPTKTIVMMFNIAKGDSIKSTYHVPGKVAEEILSRLANSYVFKTVTLLHKPFLVFSDLDGVGHVIAIEDIRKMKVSTKAAPVG